MLDRPLYLELAVTREARNKTKCFHTDKLNHTTAEAELFINFVKFYRSPISVYTKQYAHFSSLLSKQQTDNALHENDERLSRATKTYLQALRGCRNADSERV